MVERRAIVITNIKVSSTKASVYAYDLPAGDLTVLDSVYSLESVELATQSSGSLKAVAASRIGKKGSLTTLPASSIQAILYYDSDDERPAELLKVTT